MVLPFEFIIDGPPVSSQRKRKNSIQRWKDRVKREAGKHWPENTTPITNEVYLKITYFYEDDAPDVDNIIKPIQDALEGLVYINDTQVSRASSQKSNINGSFKIKGTSVDIATRLANGIEFTRIQVLPAPNHEDLT